MIRNIFSLIFVFVATCLVFSCNEEEIKGCGNIDIRKYVKCEVIDKTVSDGEYFYPKFVIIPKRQTFDLIQEYEIKYQYIFGQDWNILIDVRKHYTEKDEEIKFLNEHGEFIIEHELEKIPVETKLNPSAYYGELNYRSVDVMNCYVKVRKK